jgi:hypothetical protein
MAGFHISFPNDAAQLFKSRFEQLRKAMTKGIGVAAQNVMAEIRQKSLASIQSAGKFGPRWLNAFTIKSIPPLTTISDKYDVEIYFAGIPYAHIHEFGGTIKAKGSLFTGGEALLWIPLSFAGIKPGMTAQEYGLSVSKLFRVNRKSGGAPLLLDIKDRSPKYFGVPQVTIKPKFRIREISTQVMARFGQELSVALRAAGLENEG